ncbi:Zinc (Zn2)-Iron (Fe2) Permease (ZIP) Family [Achlya hypogyna]|uniref:Zinc (Zn2)-Iron (Fe2) Permease (ZIP) Family n=1 Tax=Achlya hypogyna TaxID=1202772 RepID=A0A1V9YGF4_ACHHY|nr:Zinc (Zn2)-Iron (Fe2) Permease (ZIP) Family [Achlya hypogyna]
MGLGDQLYILILALLLWSGPAHGHSHGGGGHDDHGECGEVEGDPDTYDTNLHIAAAFIVFAASIVGAMLPVISSYVPCLRRNQSGMEMLSSFGFGVVISTAFVHMIPPAITTLNNKCLGLNYEGVAMVIVLATIYLMQLLETELMIVLSKYTTGAKDMEAGVATPARSPELAHGHAHGVVSATPTDEESALRQKISVLIFEAGVAVHSVIVGVELGVSSGDEFPTLIVAICFHQFFEGVAVGSSALSAFSDMKTLSLSAFAYALTTPLGVVIGILISSSYSDTSPTALWVKGTFDAIAGGILVYTGIVELITYHYTINPDFHKKTFTGRGLNYMCLYLGSAAMAIIGKWA